MITYVDKDYTLSEILQQLEPVVEIPDEFYESENFNNLNSECISYNINEITKPMLWNRFINLPIEIQTRYINWLLDKYNVDKWMLSQMFKHNDIDVVRYMHKKLHIELNEWCCRTCKKYNSFLDFILL